MPSGALQPLGLSPGLSPLSRKPVLGQPDALAPLKPLRQMPSLSTPEKHTGANTADSAPIPESAAARRARLRTEEAEELEREQAERRRQRMQAEESQISEKAAAASEQAANVAAVAAEAAAEVAAEAAAEAAAAASEQAAEAAVESEQAAAAEAAASEHAAAAAASEQAAAAEAAAACEQAAAAVVSASEEADRQGAELTRSESPASARLAAKVAARNAEAHQLEQQMKERHHQNPPAAEHVDKQAAASEQAAAEADPDISVIPEAHIAMLLGDPSLAPQFDQTHGDGAAAKVLGIAPCGPEGNEPAAEEHASAVNEQGAELIRCESPASARLAAKIAARNAEAQQLEQQMKERHHQNPSAAEHAEEETPVVLEQDSDELVPSSDDSEEDGSSSSDDSDEGSSSTSSKESAISKTHTQQNLEPALEQSASPSSGSLFADDTPPGSPRDLGRDDFCKKPAATTTVPRPPPAPVARSTAPARPSRAAPAPPKPAIKVPDNDIEAKKIPVTPETPMMAARHTAMKSLVCEQLTGARDDTDTGYYTQHTDTGHYTQQTEQRTEQDDLSWNTGVSCQSTPRRGHAQPCEHVDDDEVEYWDELLPMDTSGEREGRIQFGVDKGEQSRGNGFQHDNSNKEFGIVTPDGQLQSLTSAEMICHLHNMLSSMEKRMKSQDLDSPEVAAKSCSCVIA